MFDRMVEEGFLTRHGSLLSHTDAGAREALVIGRAWAAWLEDRVERDIGRPTDTDLRAAVDAIAKRLLVEDLSNGLPQRVRQAGAADPPQPSPRSPDARTGVG
ncbi:hypothetical protein SVIOM342S_01095 [Streptomyces violaceorubidus]